MKDKILIELIVILVLALFVETTYLLELKLNQKNNFNRNHLAYKSRQANKIWKHSPFTFEFHSGYLDPLEEFNRIQDEINSSFKDHYRNFSSDTDIEEYKKNYVVRLQSPDIEKSKINIEANGNSLIISGEHNTQRKEDNKNGFYRQESFGSFRRVIPLPEDANTNKLSTKYEDGALVITIPKASTSKNIINNKVQSVL